MQENFFDASQRDVLCRGEVEDAVHQTSTRQGFVEVYNGVVWRFIGIGGILMLPQVMCRAAGCDAADLAAISKVQAGTTPRLANDKVELSLDTLAERGGSKWLGMKADRNMREEA